MKIEIGKYYLTKTESDYYSNWIVQPINKSFNTDEYLCFIIKGKDLPDARLDLPFRSHELIELSPVMKEIYE